MFFLFGPSYGNPSGDLSKKAGDTGNLANTHGDMCVLFKSVRRTKIEYMVDIELVNGC